MFTEERIGEIIKQLEEHMYPDRVALEGWQRSESAGETRPDIHVYSQNGEWIEMPQHFTWGGDCAYLLFRTRVVIPNQFNGKNVELTIRTGKEGEWDATNPQFTVYVNGQLRQGFDVNHRSIVLAKQAKAGEQYEIFLSAFTGTNNPVIEFDTAIRTVDEAVKDLYYDLLVPYQAACTMDKDEYTYIRLIGILNDAINLLDLRKWYSEGFYHSVEKAKEYLEDTLYSQEAHNQGMVLCVGHTHIDVAWLWTLSVTADKAVRSFSTVLELMDRYPEYIFMSSQPQLYLYVKKNAPEIYERIKERVKEGRWEVEGGMFVEPDCNLSSGEALVRQILYGKGFFKKEFGRDNKILWLPDVFGYSAALPQLLIKSGIRYFMTTKISWNEVNKMPYDTFYWTGIDGTRILTHFITTRDYVSKTRNLKTNNEFTTDFTTNYNGHLTPCEMRGAWQRYQQKDINDTVLCSYGYGDGGGGPTEELLEEQRRMSRGLPGMPMTQNATALSFFETLERNVAGKKTPVWTGELYLEYHRATYTSMARNKRYNRKAEFALANLEALSLLGGLWAQPAYPKELLDEKWEVVMRNQFHDILPGSSIFEVYEDSKEEYDQLFAQAGTEELRQIHALAGKTDQIVVLNLNGKEMSGLVELNAEMELPGAQKSADGTYLLHVEHVPSKGFMLLPREAVREQASASAPVTITEDMIETPCAKIRFNEKGQISFWYDKKADREILKAGQCANVLMCYEDKPFIYDNWNLFDYYKEKSWEVDALVSREVIEEGPLRYGLKLVWKYQDSTIDETLYVYPDTARVDIHLHADWKEDQIFLKALFPLDLNSSEATYEIQYGNVKRPTVYNTSWDTARFEVCYHKWMDVAEGDFGVSFLNDCKYGVSVEENTVGLSLIKCGMYPNPQADRGEHQAVYSIYPHVGSWKEAGTVDMAYLLNNPLKAVAGTAAVNTLPQRYGLVSCEQRNIMVEAVKAAEDGDGIIVRMYEFENKRTKVQLHVGVPCHQIFRTNLMEENEMLLAGDVKKLSFEMKPFEIVTLRIR